jgi:hypothetical protein
MGESRDLPEVWEVQLWRIPDVMGESRDLPEVW